MDSKITTDMVKSKYLEQNEISLKEDEPGINMLHHSGINNNFDDDSDEKSRSSSGEEGYNYKKTNYYRDKSSSSENFSKKKKKRSQSREHKRQDKGKSYYDIKKSSESPKKDHNIKHKVTSMINEKNASKIFIPGFDGPLLSLSLFNELQHNILPTEDIESAYKDYKSKYENKRYQSFYVEHSKDEWFKEKYDNEISMQWKNERNAQCQKLAKRFMEDVNNNEFKGLKLELKESDYNNKNIKITIHWYNRERDEFEEKERELNINRYDNYLDISSPPYFGFDPDKLTLFLHQVPRNVSYSKILEIVRKLPGFISMSLSEPIRNQNYVRYCWVTFDSEENCDQAYESLYEYKINNDYKIIPLKSKSSSLKRIRITPPYFDDRLIEDLEYSKSLINFLDKDKNIEENILFDRTRDRELQLDLQILYLRRVHGICYYCLEEYDDERMLATRCDNIHLRNYKKLGTRKNDDTHRYEFEWDKQFTKYIKSRIDTISATVAKTTNEVIEELNKKRNEYCKENTSALSSERYICNICSKMFKGPNFVYNHIFNKHLNLIQDFVDKEFYESLKYDNYVKDPNKIYEKYKIVSNMEDYLSYLNSIKNIHHEGESSQPQQKKSHTSHRDTSKKKRKDFKDLDDPETIVSTVVKRKLISYEDL